VGDIEPTDMTLVDILVASTISACSVKFSILGFLKNYGV
jgi:hypothetical protein